MAYARFSRLQLELGRPMNLTATPCKFCGAAQKFVASFTKPPKGETLFNMLPYYRSLWQCTRCWHIVNLHNFDFNFHVYGGNYVNNTYGETIKSKFKQIMALAPEKSDNRQRVERINLFFAKASRHMDRSCLDVGSGLGVFPAVMKESGWKCLSVEPDIRAASLIEELVGVTANSENFTQTENLGKFDLISFNKVLEHVRNPAEMLSHAISFLNFSGVIYIELPDGESALSNEGPQREEFFIEHFDAYSTSSTKLLLKAATLTPLKIERIYEPSGKYTLCAFAQPKK